MTLIASALAGGDCIDDADAMRSGGTGRVLGCTVKAPSTLGTFLRSFRWGHVRQLDRVPAAVGACVAPRPAAPPPAATADSIGAAPAPPAGVAHRRRPRPNQECTLTPGAPFKTIVARGIANARTKGS